jgi:hypothetical protein
MIKFSNPFLLFWGGFWTVINVTTGGNLFTYMMFGVCFGLIIENYREDKRNGKI